MPSLRTPLLDIDYTDDGAGAPVVLLHGWPDCAAGWDAVREGLLAAGHRVIVPSLRGSGATRFLDTDTLRDGTAPALAQDALDLADGLGLDRFAVIGHDWGARVAYCLAVLAPARLTSIAALSVGFQPHLRFAPEPTFIRTRLHWYQWLMHVDAGAQLVRDDPIGFAREQWDTWSPAGWYAEDAFALAAQSFANPDWVDITLSAYRTRFLPDEPVDPRYDDLRSMLAATAHVAVPTLCLHGDTDTCEPAESSEGLDGHFDDYRRTIVVGAGHFPHRERPDAVLAAVLEQLSR